MLPNAEHSMATGIPDLLPAATAWARGVMDGTPAPSFSWVVSPADGSITVTVDPDTGQIEASKDGERMNPEELGRIAAQRTPGRYPRFP